jgi:hypothetical protein
VTSQPIKILLQQYSKITKIQNKRLFRSLPPHLSERNKQPAEWQEEISYTDKGLNEDTMTTITFDTQEAVIKLKAVGVSQEHADAFIKVIVEAQNDLTSKRDLTDAVKEIKQDVSVLSLKITGLYLFMAAIAGGVAKLVFMP